MKQPTRQRQSLKVATAPKSQVRKLQIVRLEQRVAPRITTNHNETLLRA